MQGPLYRDFAQQTGTIASGGTTSGAFAVGAMAFLGLVVPAAFTGTSLTFTVAATLTGTYQPLYDDAGSQVSLTVAQGRSYSLPVALSTWPFFKIVSGSAEGADRTLIVVGKG